MLGINFDILDWCLTEWRECYNDNRTYRFDVTALTYIFPRNSTVLQKLRYRELRYKEGVNSASIADSIIKSSASRKTYFSVLALCTYPSGFGWKKHTSEIRRNFSPLFNGNSVLLSSEAQTDRTLLEKGFKLTYKMYLFPLTQIAANY